MLRRVLAAASAAATLAAATDLPFPLTTHAALAATAKGAVSSLMVNFEPTTGTFGPGPTKPWWTTYNAVETLCVHPS